MSVHKELKALDQPLRAAVNRRDHLKKEVLKHRRNIEHWNRKIEKVKKDHEESTEQMWGKVEQYTDKIDKEEDILPKAEALYHEAKEAVEKRLMELGALGIDRQ